MNYIDYFLKRMDLESKIAFNEKLHCHRVSARWRRELDKLNKNNPEHTKEYEDRCIKEREARRNDRVPLS